MIEHSFAPFNADMAAILSDQLGVDYRRVDFASGRWLCVSGWEDGALLGLCCFEFKNAWEAEFDIAVRDARCITRRVMRAMFRAVFSRAVRVTSHIDPTNAHAIRGALRMGFQAEGYQRKKIEGVRDAVVFGMLAEDCVYLARRPRRPASFPIDRVTEDGQHTLAS